MKVELGEFKRSIYSLGDKPFYMSTPAFVKTEMALRNLNAKVLLARHKGEDSVYLNDQEETALILYGIKYAKKDTPLGNLREVLAQTTKEKQSPVVGGLTKNFLNYLKEKGVSYEEIFGKDVTTADLVSEALSVAKERELKIDVKEEPTPEFNRLKEMFIDSIRYNYTNPYNEKEVEFYLKEIKRFLERKNASDMTREASREIYEQAQRSITWQIEKDVFIARGLLEGKTLYDEVTPDTPDHEDEVRKAKNNLISVLKSLHSAFDPEWSWSREKVKELVNLAERGMTSKEALFEVAELEVNSLKEGYEAVKKIEKEVGWHLRASELREFLEKNNLLTEEEKGAKLTPDQMAQKVIDYVKEQREKEQAQKQAERKEELQERVERFRGVRF